MGAARRARVAQLQARAVVDRIEKCLPDPNCAACGHGRRMTTPILMYRSIGETVPRGFQRWVVRPARLRAQVRGFAEAGYATLASLCRQTQRPIGSPWRSTIIRSCWPTPHSWSQRLDKSATGGIASRMAPRRASECNQLGFCNDKV
jgi:hypothetical protein